MEAGEKRGPRESRTSDGFRFLLARQNNAGIRLFDLGEIRVMPADDAVEVIEREGAFMLRDLIDSDAPILLVGTGALRRLWKETCRTDGEIDCSTEDCGKEGKPRFCNGTHQDASPAVGRAAAMVSWGASGGARDAMQPTDRIRRAIDYMLIHSKDRISLDDVSRVACLSPCYFCRLFKRETGTTYSRYLASIRVEAATRLLADSDLNVTEICYRVGFNDLTHFERVFRGRTGLSPSRYRAQAV